MKAWSDAFYKGWKFVKNKHKVDTAGKPCAGEFVNTDPFYFWKFVRQDQKIDMPSEHEYFLAHRDELIQAGCKQPGALDTEAFDFGKIDIKKVIDTQEIVAQ